MSDWLGRFGLFIVHFQRDFGRVRTPSHSAFCFRTASTNCCDLLSCMAKASSAAMARVSCTNISVKDRMMWVLAENVWSRGKESGSIPNLCSCRVCRRVDGFRCCSWVSQRKSALLLIPTCTPLWHRSNPPLLDTTHCSHPPLSHLRRVTSPCASMLTVFTICFITAMHALSGRPKRYFPIPS